MRFGNTKEHLRKPLATGLWGGVIAYLFSTAMFIFYEKKPPSCLLTLAPILIIPALGIALGIAPTLILSIHLVDEWVEHRFLDRWVLTRARAADFISMKAGVLRFSDGTKIRFLGAHPGILSSLKLELQRQSTKAH